jgi:hypothetical protein
MSQRRWRSTAGQLTLALACAAALGGCTGAPEPPAGTLPAPGASSTTAPGSVPASSSPGATGESETSAGASVDPAAYQPATPTSPAKNVPVPEMPAAAKQKDLEGQKAFIQYWIDTYNYMRESGDTKPFLAACDNSSKFCSGSVENLEVLQAKSIWRIGGHVQLSDIKLEKPESPSSHATLNGLVREAPSKFFDKNGVSDFAKPSPEEKHYTFVGVLAWTDNNWKVIEFGGGAQ